MSESFVQYSCATLAGLKCGSLFYQRTSVDFSERFSRLCNTLNAKGVGVCVLKREEGRVLLYVYRKNQLARVLAQGDVRLLLQGMGYTSLTLSEAVQTLARRIEAEGREFPHEIGIFLGYPPEDVSSFIKEQGKNALECGPWKVYHNRTEALCQFRKLRHCREVYVKQFRAGKSIDKLTVKLC